MSQFKALGLPTPPPSLKSLLPFLQRAEELKAQESIMSYWCTYHAAQVGISLKARDAPSRNFLLSLLELLEKMKKEIGPSDAIDMEIASAAYVENFALKVFSMADNEDRAGKATRSTAKKFLAASNFFEVLKVFPQSDISDTNEDKIRYSKWKAAEISKAFREGRKPAPGPADSVVEEEFTEGSSSPSLLASASPNLDSSFPTTPTTTRTSPPRILKRTTPSPELASEDIRRANADFLTPSIPSQLSSDKSVTPGRWSTAATPGGFSPTDEEPVVNEVPSFSPQSNGQHRIRAGTAATLNGQSYKASVSDEIEGKDDTLASANGYTNPTIHASHPHANDTTKPIHHINFSSSPTRRTGFTQSSPHANDTTMPIHHINFSPSSSPTRRTGFTHSLSPSTSPPKSAPVVPRFVEEPPPAPALQNVALPGAEPVFQLTPVIIAKAQKHCRFAISSLDYEDAEQARKELRAALELLGG